MPEASDKTRLIFEDQEVIDAFYSAKKNYAKKYPYGGEIKDAMMMLVLTEMFDNEYKGERVAVELLGETLRRAWQVVRDSYAWKLLPSQILAVMILKRYYELSLLKTEHAALRRIECNIEMLMSLILDVHDAPAADSASSEE